jgi:hypothetical protein
MANVVQTMIHNALGDGARSTKFECYIGLDTFGAGSKTISTMVKTASYPSKSHDVIDFKFKGRNIPLRGQVKYEQTWTCNFYMDESHTLKKAFEDAIEALDEVHTYDDPNGTVARQQGRNSSRYTNTITIVQLDFDGSQSTAIYTLYNAFPKNITQIDIDYSEVGKILEFSVEFAYSHFDMQVVKAPDGSFIDGIKGRFLGAVEGLIQKGKDAAAAAIGDLISSAKDYVMANGAGDIFGAIGSGIDSALLSLEQIDFNPSSMW